MSQDNEETPACEVGCCDLVRLHNAIQSAICSMRHPRMDSGNQTREALMMILDAADKESMKKLRSLDFYRSRIVMLSNEQKRMRDPERTLVCDIIANGQLLPDPEGKRYGMHNESSSATGREQP